MTELLKGTTNMFSSGGGSMVLVVPKSILKDLNMDAKNKVHFKIFYNKKEKKIIYQFIGEEKNE